MKFGKPIRSNPSKDLSDLQVVAEVREDGTIGLRAYLTFGIGSIFLDETKEFEIAAKTADLELHCEGLEVVPGSRHGEYDRSAVVVTEIAQERSESRERQAGGSVKVGADVSASGAPSGSAGGGADASSSNKTSATNTQKTSTSEVHLPVRALGGDRWKISESDQKKSLEGSYLGKEDLCQLAAEGRPNRLRVDAVVTVKQRNLTFTPNPDKSFLPGRGNRNQEKLIGILIAKSIHASLEDVQPYRGRIPLSVATCESGSDED